MKLKTLKNSIVCGGIAILTAMPACAFTVPFQSAKEYAASACNLMQQNRNEEALSQFKCAYYLLDTNLNKHPAGCILSDMGECARRLRRFDEALRYFSQAYPLLRTGPTGVMGRDANVLLMRWSLTYLQMHNIQQARALAKEALDNSLGLFTYNYSDLKNTPVYLEGLAEMSEGQDAYSLYQYVTGELGRLSLRKNSVGLDAQSALDQVRANRRKRLGLVSDIMPPTIHAHKHAMANGGRDPYFQPSSYRQSRARYGLNGTESLFQNKIQ